MEGWKDFIKFLFKTLAGFCLIVAVLLTTLAALAYLRPFGILDDFVIPWWFIFAGACPFWLYFVIFVRAWIKHKDW